MCHTQNSICNIVNIQVICCCCYFHSIRKYLLKIYLGACLNLVIFQQKLIHPYYFLKSHQFCVLLVFICIHLSSQPCYLVFLQPLQPHVRVWDSVTLSTLQIIGLGTFERGVGCLDFSKAVSDNFQRSKQAEPKSRKEVKLSCVFMCP